MLFSLFSGGSGVVGRQLRRLLELTGGPTALVSLSGGLWCRLDGGGRFRQRGGPWSERLGWPDGTMSRLRFWELVHPEDARLAEGASVASSDVPRTVGLRMLTAHGRYARMDWRTRRAGADVLVVSASTDADALGESRALYRGLVEATFEAVFVHEDGVVVECNDEALALLGYRRAEVLGRYIWDLAPSDSQGEIQARIARDERGEGTSWARRADGRLVPVRVRARTVEADGRRLRVVVLREGQLTPRLAGERA